MTTATERQPGFVRTSRGEGKVRTPLSQPQVAVEMIRGGGGEEMGLWLLLMRFLCFQLIVWECSVLGHPALSSQLCKKCPGLK